MKIFICDKCGKEFPQPLDEEKHKDEHGIWRSYDLCAPCRKALKEAKEIPTTEYFKKIDKKGKK